MTEAITITILVAAAAARIWAGFAFTQWLDQEPESVQRRLRRAMRRRDC